MEAGFLFGSSSCTLPWMRGKCCYFTCRWLRPNKKRHVQSRDWNRMCDNEVELAFVTSLTFECWWRGDYCEIYLEYHWGTVGCIINKCTHEFGSTWWMLRTFLFDFDMAWCTITKSCFNFDQFEITIWPLFEVINYLLWMFLLKMFFILTDLKISNNSQNGLPNSKKN